MPRRLNLPDSASVATPAGDGRLFAPSAARNAEAIATLVAAHAPETGRALELAAGTGEHAVVMAGRLPGLTWQPTDIDADRRRSIDAHAAIAELPNLQPAISLDATSPGWGNQHAGQDLIVLVNLLHLISEAEAKTLIAEVGQEAGMETVAEYVQDAETLGLLAELGVDMAQGHFVGEATESPEHKSTPISLDTHRLRKLNP